MINGTPLTKTQKIYSQTLLYFLFIVFYGTALNPQPNRATENSVIEKEKNVELDTPHPLMSPLLLEEAIEAGLKNHPGILEAEALLDIAQAQKLKELSAHLPQISARGQYYFAGQYPNFLINQNQLSIPLAFPQSMLQAEIKILLFDGLISIQRFQASVLEYEAAQLSLEREKLFIENQIKLKFFEALVSERLIQIHEENISELSIHYDWMLKHRGGTPQTSFDLLRIETELNEMRLERLLVIDHARLAKRALSQAMGVHPSPESLKRPLRGEFIEPDMHKIGTEWELSLKDRQDFQAIEKKELALEKRDSAEARYWLPVISIFGQEGFYQFNSQFGSDDIVGSSALKNNYAVGVFLFWNLFDGGASMALSRKLSASIRKEAAKERQHLIDVTEDFEIWKLRYIRYAALYHSRKELLEKIKQSVELAQEGLEKRTQSQVDYLLAVSDWFRTRIRLLRAQADAEIALIQLELSSGRKLEN